MKYTVTVRVINEFAIDVSAKDMDTAREKVEELYQKTGGIEIDYQKMGKFDHYSEEIEVDVDEA